MTPSKPKLGFNKTWSMAVGGMIGGGIFSTLGRQIGQSLSGAVYKYNGLANVHC